MFPWTEHSAIRSTYTPQMKVATQNNLLKKLSTSKWGTKASTTRITALALCYSVADYACTAWERSAHVHHLDPELNQACRYMTGCLKASSIEDICLLAGFSPPAIRRKLCANVEKKKNGIQGSHSLFGQKSVENRLQSRNCFLSSVHPAEFPAKVVRSSECQKRLKDQPYYKPVLPDENFAT